MFHKKSFLFILSISCTILTYAQMLVGSDTLYGNEWISSDKAYYKFPVVEDALYKILYKDLKKSGFPVDSVPGNKFQLFCLGKEVPIFTSSSGIFNVNDYIEFYGKRNRTEIDKYLFDKPEKDMLNSDYSMFNDSISYFLTWGESVSSHRIVLINNDTASFILPEKYYGFKESICFNSTRNKPTNFIGEYNSRFDVGEGYGNGITNSLIIPFTITSLSPNPDSIKIEIRLYTLPQFHNLVIKLNGIIILEIQSEGKELINKTISIPILILLQTNNLVITELDPGATGFVMANCNIKYNRLWTSTNPFPLAIELESNNEPRKVEIPYNNSNGAEVFLYDLSANIKLKGFLSGNTLKYLLPAFIGQRVLVIRNENEYKSIDLLEKLVFTNLKPINSDYIIITNKALFNDGSGINLIEEYSNYRKSNEGGGHKVSIIEIQELYDQFAYGNNRNIIAIRNFSHFIKKFWPQSKSLFLIGKGREYPDIRNSGTLNNLNNKSFFLPVFGSPGSDNLFVISQGDRSPFMSIGRIAAENSDDIKNYLDKIKEFESVKFNEQNIKEQSWKKEIIHLGGGNTKDLQNALKNLLTEMEDIIETNSFGAHVNSYFKTSSDPIQISQNQKIFDRINSGVSIITFLGHSAVGTFDFSIDNPQNYNNTGKYPLMFSLGCYSGNYNTSTRSIGENFCFYKAKGALGFIATSYVGIPSILSEFTDEFYRQLGGSAYGKSVGEILKLSYSQLNQKSDEYYRLITEQMSFHGDPAFTIKSNLGQDYCFDVSTLKFTPSIIYSNLDSFKIAVEIINLGEHIDDSINISINIKLPEGEIRHIKSLKIKCPSNRFNLITTLPLYGKYSVGRNVLLIELDPENQIHELPYPEAEKNNELTENTNIGFEFYVRDYEILLVKPPEFGIVNYPDINLKAFTSDIFSKGRIYYFELDTSCLFNTSLKLSEKLISDGGIINWKPVFNFIDSTTYFWRVAGDSSNTKLPLTWSTSSFFYKLNSNEGWSQSNTGQFKKDELVNLNLDSTGKLDFVDDIKDIFIQNYLRSSGIYPAYYLNNTLSEINYGNDILSGVYVAVIDPKTGIPWVNPKGGKYGSQTPQGWRDRKAFPFSTSDPAQREKLINFLNDTIPFGSYVVFFTIQDVVNDYKPHVWSQDSLIYGTDIFQLLEKEGAKLIRETINKSYPYSLVYQKGLGTLSEVLADNKEGLANLNTSITGSWDKGILTTGLIGPSLGWDELELDIETENSDSVSLEVYGVNNINNTELLLKISDPTTTIDLSFIDHIKYPYLQLKLFLSDSLQKTIPELKSIRVYYQTATDLVISNDNKIDIYKDSIEQGEILKLTIPVFNIGNIKSDTIAIKYSISSADNTKWSINDNIVEIKPDSSILINYQLNTKDLTGNYSLQVEVNPNRTLREINYLNNNAFLNFTVVTDKTNPVLHVKFDGKIIVNGEIVSATPQIEAVLFDENKYFPLIDTSTFKLYLKYTNTNKFVNIPLNSPEVQFVPATEGNTENKASLIYKPKKLDEGIYELKIIGKDVAGNFSGNLEYKVQFKVTNQRSLFSFLPYPNPTTGLLAFNYTLTGDIPPFSSSLRIYNIKGNLVKQIKIEELGLLKIGQHNTNNILIDRDNNGKILSNGTYIFQLELLDSEGYKWSNKKLTLDTFIPFHSGKFIILR